MAISKEIKHKAIFVAFPIVANEEGYREKAYKNAPKEPWTVGFGFTFWPDGRNVVEGDRMGRIDAEIMLQNQVNSRFLDIVSCIKPEIQPKLTANMLAALISIHHNLGPGNFRKAVFLKLINEGKFKQAADAFLNWKRGNTSNDLLPRRKRERQLFLTPDK